MRRLRLFLLSAALAGALSGTAEAAQCGKTAAGFDAWKEQFRAEAGGYGLSDRSLASLDAATYDTEVIRLDRSQKPFKASYPTFRKARLLPGRISQGKARMQKHAKLLAGLEQRYGVPGEVLVAIWGMETDYGAVRGKKGAVRSLATLAYDCRRTELFTRELVAALTLIEKGRLTSKQMTGGWAGEIGQTQFLASSYLRFAADGNGDGRADVVGNPADVLASTANYLRGYGWQPGAGYQPGQPNFAVIKEWNKSENYQKVIAEFAAILGGTS